MWFFWSGPCIPSFFPTSSCIPLHCMLIHLFYFCLLSVLVVSSMATASQNLRCFSCPCLGPPFPWLFPLMTTFIVFEVDNSHQGRTDCSFSLLIWNCCSQSILLQYFIVVVTTTCFHNEEHDSFQSLEWYFHCFLFNSFFYHFLLKNHSLYLNFCKVMWHWWCVCVWVLRAWFTFMITSLKLCNTLRFVNGASDHNLEIISWKHGKVFSLTISFPQQRIERKYNNSIFNMD